ncbi:hypothetical protein ABIA33_003042 [Streptacidiphilus sp. MAP12-16]
MQHQYEQRYHTLRAKAVATAAAVITPALAAQAATLLR